MKKNNDVTTDQPKNSEKLPIIAKITKFTAKTKRERIDDFTISFMLAFLYDIECSLKAKISAIITAAPTKNEIEK